MGMRRLPLKSSVGCSRLPVASLYPRLSQAYSDTNFLTVEKDELTLTLWNIWLFSFERDEILLILDSGRKI